jgi:hypothetical protein
MMIDDTQVVPAPKPLIDSPPVERVVNEAFFEQLQSLKDFKPEAFLQVCSSIPRISRLPLHGHT